MAWGLLVLTNFNVQDSKAPYHKTGEYHKERNYIKPIGREGFRVAGRCYEQASYVANTPYIILCTPLQPNNACS